MAAAGEDIKTRAIEIEAHAVVEKRRLLAVARDWRGKRGLHLAQRRLREPCLAPVTKQAVLGGDLVGAKGARSCRLVPGQRRVVAEAPMLHQFERLHEDGLSARTGSAVGRPKPQEGLIGGPFPDGKCGDLARARGSCHGREPGDDKTMTGSRPVHDVSCHGH